MLGHGLFGYASAREVDAVEMSVTDIARQLILEFRATLKDAHFKPTLAQDLRLRIIDLAERIRQLAFQGDLHAFAFFAPSYLEFGLSGFLNNVRFILTDEDHITPTIDKLEPCSLHLALIALRNISSRCRYLTGKNAADIHFLLYAKEFAASFCQHTSPPHVDPGNYRLATNIESLSFYFQEYLGQAKCNEAERQQTNRVYKILSADSVKTLINSTIEYAQAGSLSALNQLIDWYENGNTELRIEADLTEADFWKRKKENLKSFLIEKINLCYDLVIQNYIRHGVSVLLSEHVCLRSNIQYYQLTQSNIIHADDAVALFYDELAMRAGRSDPYALQTLAEALMRGTFPLRKPRLTHAKVYFRQLLSLFPLNDEDIREGAAAYNLATLCHDELESREELLLQACEFGSDYAAYDLGVLNWERGDFAAAVEFFEKAIRLCEESNAAESVLRFLDRLDIQEHANHITEIYHVIELLIKKGYSSVIYTQINHLNLIGADQLAASCGNLLQMRLNNAGFSREEEMQHYNSQVDGLIKASIEALNENVKSKRIRMVA